MKTFWNKFAAIAATLCAVLVFSVSSCSKDDDSSEQNSKPQGSFGTSADAFYNGFVNNGGLETGDACKVLVIDIRKASEFSNGHLKGAINIDCVSTDDAYFNNNSEIYQTAESLDPNHEKDILLCGNGASTMATHIAERLAKMGWTGKKVFLLMVDFSQFQKKFENADPAVIE